MDESVPNQNRLKKIAFYFSHVLLAVLGIYNLYSTGSYFLSTSKIIHSQGVGYLYIIIAMFVSFVWFILVFWLCLFGSLSMPKIDDEIRFKNFIMPLVGAILSRYLPELMLFAWFFIIVWIRSFL
jgi:hypothetical protein